MNLEEELMLNNLENEMPTQPVQEVQQVMPTQQVVTQQPVMTQPIQETQQINQSAMVNINRAESQVSQFDFGDMDAEKRVSLRNPLVRLAGETGQVFRIHQLPGVSPKIVYIHSDKEKQRSFVCFKNSLGIQDAKCCSTHGYAKARIVIPVIVYMTSSNQVVPNANAELKVLILNDKDYDTLKEQSLQSANKELSVVDIIATVKDKQFKSFNFAINANESIAQVPNIEALKKEWEVNGTPENICKACAMLISYDEYMSDYSSYNYRDYYQNKQQVAPQQYQPQYQQQGFGAQYPQQTGYQQPAQQYQVGFQPQDVMSDMPW